MGFHYANATIHAGRLQLRIAEFGRQQFVLVDVPEFAFPIYIHRLDDSTYSAVSTRCMHLGCQVEPVDGRLVCPCHGSEYTADGAVLKGPTVRPLRNFPVSVQEGWVIVDLTAGERAP
jgi:Rieske Fe-S protein